MKTKAPNCLYISFISEFLNLFNNKSEIIFDIYIIGVGITFIVS